MALKYNPTSLQDLITHHIALYYLKLEEIPHVRNNHDQHLIEVNILDRHYKKLLFENDWEIPATEPLFREQIDFLTKVYTKEKEIQEAKEEVKRFKKMALG